MGSEMCIRDRFITKVQTVVDKAIDKALEKIVTVVKKLGRSIVQAGVPQDPNERLSVGLDAATSAVNALRDSSLSGSLINPVLLAVKVRYGFQTLQPVERDGDWWIEGQVNPKTAKKTRKRVSKEGRAVAATLLGKNIDSVYTSLPEEYRSVVYDTKRDVERSGRGYSAPELSCDKTGVIKNGRGIRRADYYMIDEYNLEAGKITADLGRRCV